MAAAVESVHARKDTRYPAMTPTLRKHRSDAGLLRASRGRSVSRPTHYDLKTPHSPNPETVEPVATATPDSGALLKELAERKDVYLRLAADFDNYKRRSRQEAEARAAAQKEGFIFELLPVVDNLERALASGASRDTAQFHQGVAMTLKQLQQLLRQHGVESDEILGQAFDAHRHEALSQGHDPAQPDHVVLSVLQRGYRQGEKVMRPAKVTINDLTTPHHDRDGR